MRFRWMALLLPLLLLAPACPPPEPPVPPFDAGDGGIVVVDASTRDSSPAPLTDASSDAPLTLNEAACANLKALACKEGLASNCVEVMNHAQGHLTDFHPDCLAKAKTKAQARACKSVDCP